MNMKEIYASLLEEEQDAVPRQETIEESIARITPIVEETIKKLFTTLNRYNLKFLISSYEEAGFTAFPYAEIDFTHRITWGIYISFMFISPTGETKVVNVETIPFSAFSHIGCPSTMMNPHSLDGLFADEEKVVYHSPWPADKKKVGFRFIV